MTATKTRPPTSEQLHAAAMAYIDELGCSFWGFTGSVHSDEKRSIAAQWLTETMVKVLERVE